MWITILPLIIDLIKEALKLAADMPDPVEKAGTRECLRTTLKDFDVHQDVAVLQGALREIGNGGARR